MAEKRLNNLTRTNEAIAQKIQSDMNAVLSEPNMTPGKAYYYAIALASRLTEDYPYKQVKEGFSIYLSKHPERNFRKI